MSSFFTPVQDPPAGTPHDYSTAPPLFQPLKIRSLSLHNRIIVSPMCQYSSPDGHFTPWHKQHLGSLATRGPALVITEATSVSSEGRITPNDAGLWSDSQMPALKEIVQYAHSQNSKIAIQLSHAGRKASTQEPWAGRGKAVPKEAGGWPGEVVGPSDTPYTEGYPVPRAMTVEDIDKFKQDWAAAVKRALSIGFDAINIHAAHGYLLSEFLSPASNLRTDKYGGSFENRTRLLLEIVELTRSIVQDDFPVMIRLNATDYLNFDASLPQWHVEEACQLAKLLADRGIDFIDVSAGGNDSRQKIDAVPGYQVQWAKKIKDAVAGSGVLVSAVGRIEGGEQANGYLERKELDAVMAARPFLTNPNLVVTWAEDLKVPIYVAAQYGWAFGQKRYNTKPDSHRLAAL